MSYFPRSEKLIIELCEEIDMWKEEAERYKKLYKDELNEHLAYVKERNIETMKGVSNMLSLALNIKEDGNGGLVIDSDSRANIVNHLKETS